jgi:redox-sensitive bicupin YhaK (pirin superfamily)
MKPTTTPPAVTDTGRRRAPQLVVDAIHNGPTFASDDSWFLLPPDTARWDPFIVLVEDRFSTRGFPWHPHRGFQTLTYVLDGTLEHRDNAGGFGVLGRGDAQYMIAGRYAMHYELAHQLEPVHTLQAWINLPAAHKLGPSGYVDLTRGGATRIDAPGVVARLHVGTVAGHTGADADRFTVPLTLLDAELDAGASFTHEVPGDHAVALYVAEGTVRLGLDGPRVGPHQTAWFDAGDPGATSIRIEADTAAFVIAYSGRPVREVVVAGGPFLMNTAAENAQAMAEFRAGRFGPIPDDPTPTDAATRR